MQNQEKYCEFESFRFDKKGEFEHVTKIFSFIIHIYEIDN